MPYWQPTFYRILFSADAFPHHTYLKKEIIHDSQPPIRCDNTTVAGWRLVSPSCLHTTGRSPLPHFKRKLDPYTTYLILQGASSLFFTLIVTVNLIYQVQVVRLNPLQLTLVGTMLESVSFIFQVPTGVIADVYSRRAAVIAGTFLIGAGFAIEGSIPHFAAVLLAQVVWGIGATLVDGADNAWLADEIGEDRVAHAYLRGSQLGQVAGVVGVVIAMALGSIRINLPMLAGGAAYAALAVFLLIVMPEQSFHRTLSEDRTSFQEMGETLRAGFGLVRRRPVLLTILGVALVFGMSGEGYDRLWTAHMLNDVPFPTLGHLQPVVWFGLLSLGAAPLTIAATELVRRLDLGREALVARTLFVVNALRVVCIAVFGLAAGFPLAVAAIWGATVLRGLSRPVYDSWLIRHIDPRVRATVLSLSGQADALGQIAGGPVIGAIGTLISLRAAIVAAAVALLPSLPLFVRASRQTALADLPAASEEVRAAAGS